MFEWDDAKSEANLQARCFDFAFAARIFDGPTLELDDVRADYGELRIQAIGRADRVVLFVPNGRRRYVARGRPPDHIRTSRQSKGA